MTPDFKIRIIIMEDQQKIIIECLKIANAELKNELNARESELKSAGFDWAASMARTHRKNQEQATHIEGWVKFIHGNWIGNFTPELKRMLNESPAQSLSIIKADAIEEMMNDIPDDGEGGVSEDSIYDYIAQLRGE